jgi:hypothetical protein
MFSPSDLQFTYDSYQDVRKNLFKYSIIPLLIAGFFAYLRILPQSHRDFVDNFFLTLNSPTWIKPLSGIAAFTLVAFVLTEIIKVHDQWYDKYITKWRYFYAIDYILPRLIQPFASNVSARFFDVAASNVGAFQEQLYYPFVGDRDNKIGKNKLVRFYEVITVYWLTQINEIVIVTLFVAIAAYRLIGPSDLSYRASLLDSAIWLALAFVLNRAWAFRSLKKVRDATADEINDITRNHAPDLESRLKEVCKDYGIKYAEPRKH